jgi:uncharacterized membrane protein
MAFCKACGQDAGEASFCPKCGAPQSASQPSYQSATQSAPVSSPAGGAAPAAAFPTAGLDENVAGLLSYIVGWITGLVFLLIDKRPFVRFHAAQSIALNVAFVVLWIAVWIISIILGFITTLIFHFPLGFLLAFLLPLIGIGFFVLFIYCMVKAYQHEKFKVPVLGNMVEKMVGQ